MGSVRKMQVAEMIKRHFSLVLQQEGRYIYEDALVTITNVIMSADLGLAKIYVSIYNTENKQEVLLSLEDNYVRLKQLLSARLRKQIRRVPDFRIYIDDTLDEMERIDKLFVNL